MAIAAPVPGDTTNQLLIKLVGNAASAGDTTNQLLAKLVAAAAGQSDGGGGGGSGVTSLAGTAGQVAASAATGAVTLSLPSALTGINSVTSVAGQPLVLRTGTFGDALTIASATGQLISAGGILVSGGGTGITISSGSLDVTNGGDISSANIRAANSGLIYFTGRSILASSADGILKISNQAQTDFGRLQLGGTTSSFPAIKRNGAGIDFVLADDAGFAVIKAASLVAGSVTSVAGTALTLGTGTSGTALTIASATNIATFTKEVDITLTADVTAFRVTQFAGVRSFEFGNEGMKCNTIAVFGGSFQNLGSFEVTTGATSRPAFAGFVASGHSANIFVLYKNGSVVSGFNSTGGVFTNDSTEATVGGAGSIITTGGGYFAKKVVSSGDFEAADIGEGYIVKSPDGTRYRITVANGGAIVTAAA